MSLSRYSVFGIHLGMGAAEAGRKAQAGGARFAGFVGAHVTYKSRLGLVYVQVDGDGQVVSVAGPRLEDCGTVVAQVGSPPDDLVDSLGEPEHSSAVDFERLVEEIQRRSPELEVGEGGMQARREFWWYHEGALSILVDGRGAHSFHLQGTPAGG